MISVLMWGQVVPESQTKAWRWMGRNLRIYIHIYMYIKYVTYMVSVLMYVGAGDAGEPGQRAAADGPGRADRARHVLAALHGAGVQL
jgi:hypothetical protein